MNPKTTPVYVIAEIGINYATENTPSRSSRLQAAIDLIGEAAHAGVDAVKFQKRTPELCVPKDQQDVPKETPWGETMTYLEYREEMELNEEECLELQRVAEGAGVDLFWSVWDLGSLEWTEAFHPQIHKLPSAKLTDLSLVHATAEALASRGARALILSTGMSTIDEIQRAVTEADEVMRVSTPEDLDRPELWVMHCHSAYPAPTEELNLRCVPELQRHLSDWCTDGTYRVGYSGHEYGRAPTEWAAVLGATVLERHLTMDCTAKGSDHASSLEPWVMGRLVSHIKSLEKALGDGVKNVWPSELPALEKLRGSDVG